MPFHRAWFTSRTAADSASAAAVPKIVAAYLAASGLDSVIAAGEAPQLAAPTARFEVLATEAIPAGALPAPLDGRPTVRTLYEVTDVVSGARGRCYNVVPATYVEATLDTPTIAGIAIAATLADVESFGSVPPVVSLTGALGPSVLGVRIEITLGGSRGTATFRWSIDSGASWGGVGVLTNTSVALGSSGLSAVFAVGTYATDNVYTAALVPAYTTPAVVLSGTPAAGVPSIDIQITTAGALGVAVFHWSIDGGATWVAIETTAASVVLGLTGVTASFGDGTYGLSVSYASTITLAHWTGPLVGDVSYHTIGDALEWRTRVVRAPDGRYAVDLFTLPEGT